MTQLTGVVEKLYPKDDKGDGGVGIGGKFYKYSALNKRSEPWEPPASEGVTVAIDYETSEYNGKEYRWCQAIKVISENGASPRSGEFRTADQRLRGDALRAAVDYAASQAEAMTPEDVIRRADRFLTFLQGGSE